MNPQEINDTLRDVQAGTQLCITFKKGNTLKIDPSVARGPLTLFSQMFMRRMLTPMSEMDLLVLNLVIESCDWEMDQNRTFKVRTTSEFSTSLFATHIGGWLQSVTVIK